MKQFRHPHPPSEAKPAVARTSLAREQVFRRIAEACIRLETKSREALRRETMDLFDEAVFAHLAAKRRPAISDSYRQLQWSVLEACGTLVQLPSETTFRRRIARGRKRATDALTGRVRASR